MLRLNSRIEIEGEKSWEFTFVTEVTIERSWRNLTQFGSLVIPRKIVWDGLDLINRENPLIKRGDKIKVYLGYYPSLDKYFDGYITKIIPDKPLRVEFEDSMWLLKQRSISKYSGKNLTLNKLLTDLGVPGILPMVTADVQIGKFMASNTTVAKVLDYLQENYGIISYVRNGTLYSGVAYYTSDTAFGNLSGEVKEGDGPRKFKRIFQQNIISSNLEYSRKDDQRIKVKAISIQSDNTKIEVEVGDSDGDIRTIHQYGLSESELTAYANNYLPKLKVEGFEGDFETFGDQFCDHGDSVELINLDLPDQNGTYLISKVITNFGFDTGFRNNIELDGKNE